MIRCSRHRKDRWDEVGDTLIEVLFTILILSVTGLALLEAFSASITGSAQYRSLAANDVILRAAAESAFSLISQQSSPLYSQCATASTYNVPAEPTPPSTYGAYGVPSTYRATVTSIQYWENGAWQTGCTATAVAQQITLQVTNPNNTTESTTFVVSNFNASLTGATLVTLSALTPSEIGQGKTIQMTLTGSGFQPDAQVTVSGLDVAVSTTYVSSSTLHLTVSALNTATLGTRTVTVTNKLEGTSGSSDNFLTVDLSPTVNSVSPSIIAQGGTESLVIIGTSFVSGMSVVIYTSSGGDSGVTVTSVSNVTPNSANVAVSVALTAQTTFLDTIRVTIPGGASFVSNPLLQVTPPPTITSVTTTSNSTSPCNPGSGGTANCTIKGTNFQPGAQVSISANGVANNPASSVAATQIVIGVTGTGASGATGDIVVTNPDGTTATAVGAFVNGP